MMQGADGEFLDCLRDILEKRVFSEDEAQLELDLLVVCHVFPCPDAPWDWIFFTDICHKHQLYMWVNISHMDGMGL